MIDIIFYTKGQYQSRRVVLNAGSQSNFITEKCCDKLKLYKRTVDIPISGIGKTLSHIKHSVTIKSKIESFVLNLDCLVIPSITENLPVRAIERKHLDIPKNIALADPTFDQPKQVDMLIGAEYFYHLLWIDQIKLKMGTTTLQKTRLGWVVSGRIYSSDVSTIKLCHLSRRNST